MLRAHPGPVAVALTLMGTLAAGCGCGAAGETAATPAQALVAPTIVVPTDGSTTSSRSLRVTGRTPTAPAGGNVVLLVKANRRSVEPDARNGSFATAVALELGANTITADAEVDGADEAPIARLVSNVVHVTRVAGPDTGTLDLATAYRVTDYSDEVYWACGEAEDCGTAVRCIALGPHRVDCPIGRSTVSDPINTCVAVMTVRVRARRLYDGHYGCHGRLLPVPRRHVRREVHPSTRRFRLDLREAPWLRDEVNLPTRYGVPRIEPGPDLFIP